MNNKAIGCTIMLVIVLGCTSSHLPSDPTQSRQSKSRSSDKKIQVKGVEKVNFPNGGVALVMEYETELSIEDMSSLRKEVDAIWEGFQKDAEEAQVKSAVIRATHYESSGVFRQGKGFGFVFVKDQDGKWRLRDNKGR